MKIERITKKTLLAVIKDEEYTNYEARQAAQIRAKELLDLILE